LARMKRRPIASVLLSSLLVIAPFALARAETQSDEKPTRYFVVLLTRPSNAPRLTKEDYEKLQEKRLVNIRKLTAEQKLVIEGPCMDDSPLRGILVFRTDSAAQALEWASSDPAVEAGDLDAEAHGPWLVDADAIQRRSRREGPEQYTLVLMERTDKWKLDAVGFNFVVKEYPTFTREMVARGYVAVAGLFPLPVPGRLRAVTIFRVGADQTAALLRDDPTVKEGLLRPEIHPWASSEGVLASGTPMQ
jgi:uncharacterized protein YciI